MVILESVASRHCISEGLLCSFARILISCGTFPTQQTSYGSNIETLSKNCVSVDREWLHLLLGRWGLSM